MLNGHITKGAMIVDDLQLVVAALCVSSETVGTQGVCHRTHCRTQRTMSGCEIFPRQPRCHRPAIFGADLFGHLFCQFGRKMRQGAPQQ